MPNRWLFKTEPGTYSYDQLERERRTVWDGVKNALALKHLSSVAEGDEILFYHTGGEKAVVGVARVVRGAYPDPKQKDPLSEWQTSISSARSNSGRCFLDSWAESSWIHPGRWFPM